jgi:large subunit ribosomal protein L24
MPGIRKGDLVEVITGNERGKRGRVLRTIPERDRLVVEGINVRWKHMRKSPKAPQGGRLKREMPIHRSNVMLYDEASGKRSRLGSAVVDGKKVRILRTSGAPVGAAPAAPAAKEKKAPAKRAAKKPAATKDKES